MAGNCVLNSGSQLGQLYLEEMFTIFQGKSMAQKKLRTSNLSKLYDTRSGKMLMAFKPHNRQTGAVTWEYLKMMGSFLPHGLSPDFINCGSWSDAVFNFQWWNCVESTAGQEPLWTEAISNRPKARKPGSAWVFSDAVWPRASHMISLGSHPTHKLATVLTTVLGEDQH